MCVREMWPVVEALLAENNLMTGEVKPLMDSGMAVCLIGQCVCGSTIDLHLLESRLIISSDSRNSTHYGSGFTSDRDMFPLCTVFLLV